MALRRLALFKKSALATRDYSPPPIGSPWLAAFEIIIYRFFKTLVEVKVF
jgi:hypothetical protein